METALQSESCHGGDLTNERSPHNDPNNYVCLLAMGAPCPPAAEAVGAVSDSDTESEITESKEPLL